MDKLTVLIADDSETVRRMLATLLAALGAGRVFIADNGHEALKTFFHYCPDLVITDAAMAPIDGYELLETIRTHPASPDPHVPVIMISALTHEEHVTRARAMGASVLLGKPVAPESLYKAVIDALNGAAQAEWRVADRSGPETPVESGDKTETPGFTAPRSRMLH